MDWSQTKAWRLELVIGDVLRTQVRMLIVSGICKLKRPRKIWKKKKWLVSPKLFRIHNKRHQDPRHPPMYYTKAVESFVVSKIAHQLCDQGHDSIFSTREGYNLDHNPCAFCAKPMWGIALNWLLQDVQCRWPCELGWACGLLEIQNHVKRIITKI